MKVLPIIDNPKFTYCYDAEGSPLYEGDIVEYSSVRCPYPRYDPVSPNDGWQRIVAIVTWQDNEGTFYLRHWLPVPKDQVTVPLKLTAPVSSADCTHRR